MPHNMYLDFPIRSIERRIAFSLNIIVEILRRLRNDLAGFELMRRRDRERRGVGLQSAPPSIRESRKTRSPEHVGGASNAKGPRPVEDVRVDHGGFHVLVTAELLDRPNIIAVLD